MTRKINQKLKNKYIGKYNTRTSISIKQLSNNYFANAFETSNKYQFGTHSDYVENNHFETHSRDTRKRKLESLPQSGFGLTRYTSC